ncbi:unnamed protein product [Mytilus coruscus]|uniref:Uncharacterized protein n=1 Tax=Mytilus coruscus TaxID=42192 RepID=A0A6J8E0G2_MYTCO|nr:unnamed protein product [Mytilus coruscus]
MKSADEIIWSDVLREHFEFAQKSLSSRKAITLPKCSDQLRIVTDGSVTKVKRGIGATLYINRDGKVSLAGFLSAKLLPSLLSIQSKLQANVLTDSKPCVQSFEKLCPASPRVTSFLSVVSRYQVSVNHLSGLANIPSDFASRNAPLCTEPNCQVCCFISRTEDSVVRAVSIQDVLNDEFRLPFTTWSAWINIQSECPDLRRTHAHLKQGTRPSKKLTNIKDVKRYLNVASIAKDGLLVVRRCDPLAPPNELIIVPRSVLDGLVTALHIKLDHPSKHQLILVLKRHFYALDMPKAAEQASDSCHICASLKRFPKSLVEQSSEDPPDLVGISYVADVLKRNRQLILVVRETVTSYTRNQLRASSYKVKLSECYKVLNTILVSVHRNPRYSQNEYNEESDFDDHDEDSLHRPIPDLPPARAEPPPILICENIDDVGNLDEPTGLPDNSLERDITHSIGMLTLNKRLGCLNTDKNNPAAVASIIRNVQDMFQEAMFMPFQSYFIVYAELALQKDFLTKLQHEGKLDEYLEKEPNFMYSLLSGSRVTDNQVNSIVMDLFGTGIDSSANTLVFLLYQLAVNQDKQAKLFEEIEKVVCNSPTLTKEQLASMSYMKACLKESHKVIFPTSAGLARVIESDLVIGGYRFPKDTLMIINMSSMSADDRFFSQPTEFLPERWLRNTTDELAKSKEFSFAHKPFGFGPRSCIGQRFAENEIFICLTKIIQHFKVSVPTDTHEMKTTIQLFTTPVDKVKMTFTRREKM